MIPACPTHPSPDKACLDCRLWLRAKRNAYRRKERAASKALKKEALARVKQWLDDVEEWAMDDKEHDHQLGPDELVDELSHALGDLPLRVYDRAWRKEEEKIRASREELAELEERIGKLRAELGEKEESQ